MPLQLANCGLSPETVGALNERGILSLFPIQKHVFDPAAAGRDLIGRAKTGSGKTLAFALPVIEELLKASLSDCSQEHHGAEATGYHQAARALPRQQNLTCGSALRSWHPISCLSLRLKQNSCVAPGTSDQS